MPSYLQEPPRATILARSHNALRPLILKLPTDILLSIADHLSLNGALLPSMLLRATCVRFATVVPSPHYDFPHAFQRNYARKAYVTFLKKYELNRFGEKPRWEKSSKKMLEKYGLVEENILGVTCPTCLRGRDPLHDRDGVSSSTLLTGSPTHQPISSMSSTHLIFLARAHNAHSPLLSLPIELLLLIVGDVERDILSILAYHISCTNSTVAARKSYINTDSACIPSVSPRSTSNTG
ncbi:hypothetical protein K504DRAFT_497870 [Pleomassaria siparia CBS 279.74]|uniref:Uncharacterized protein n=1 Tax=Pleomassaria siparia CBS 279.74 TaxID=1314801 RepID=A0A6G1KJM2_9PLEO|nr:hypothetical protein K504DRAFT_497870 [Pleomassaria siparia CBS 279.74]